MNNLQLYIKGITGKTITISCLNDITVRDLKVLISKKIENIEPYFIRLVYGNQELNDEQFLNELEIKNEGTIYYLIKLNKEVEILMEIKRHWNLNNNWSRDIELSGWDGIEVHEESDSKFIVGRIIFR